MGAVQPVEPSEPCETDGRLLRAVRSRQLVVETFLDLLDAGETQPTAQQVSDRSGVSMRSIFRLFDDVDALHKAAIATEFDRVSHLVVAIDSTGPVEVRVKALVDSRAALFEAISPVRRMGARLGPTSRPIREDQEQTNRFFRKQVADVFALELQVLTPARRRTLLDELDAVTSWEMWERLRSSQCVSEGRARGLATDLVLQILRTSASG